MITLLIQLAQGAVSDPARRSAQLKSIGIIIAVIVFIIVMLIGGNRKR